MVPKPTTASRRSGEISTGTSDLRPAVAYLRSLADMLGVATKLKQRFWRVTALAHVVALARDLEFVAQRHPGIATAPAASGWLNESCALLSSACDAGYEGPSVEAKLQRLKGLQRRWKPAEVEAWVRAANSATMHGTPRVVRTLACHLRQGDIERARELAKEREARGYRSKRGLSDALAAGVAMQRWSHGLAGPTATFVADVSDPEWAAKTFRPSVAMVAALATAGVRGRQQAQGILVQLPKTVQQEARMWLAVGVLRGGDAAAARAQLAQIRHGSWRDRALVEFVRYHSQVPADVGCIRQTANSELAAAWLRLITSAGSRALAATHMGCAALSAGAVDVATRYLRRALKACPSKPEVQMLAARLGAATGGDYQGPIHAALASLRGDCKQRRQSVRVAPPVGASLSSVGTVLRDLLSIWVTTKDSDVLAAIRRSWVAECMASPQVVRPLLIGNDLGGAQYSAVSSLVAAMPSVARLVVGDALRCTWLAERANAMDAGRALAKVASTLIPVSSEVGSTGAASEETAPDDVLAVTAVSVQKMQILGALCGPQWPGRPKHGALRVAFEEGSSLAPQSKASSRALTLAAKRRIILGLSPDADVEAKELVSSSLRILENLGGTREHDLLVDMVAFSLESPIRGEVLSALIRQAPRRAAVLLWQHFSELTHDRNSARRILRSLEDGGGIPKGWTAGWDQLLASLVQRHPECDTYAWWGGFAAAWWERHSRPLSLDGLAIIASEATAFPWETVVEFTRKARLSGSNLSDLAQRLERTDALFERLACSGGAAIPRAQGIAKDWWRSMFATASKMFEGPPHNVQEVISALGTTSSARREWEPEPFGFAEPVPLTGSTRQLRLLNKRRDILAYLRLTDSVSCCLSNAERTFPSWQTRRVATLWRDPLSFAFQVERLADGVATADGFVFGSFGISANRAVILLNGLYLNRQTANARSQVLAAIEEHWARPLGATGIGIATRYGGTGPLPAQYQRRSVRVRRSCGLAGPVNLYDDLKLENQEVTLSTDLMWKLWGPVEVVVGR